MICLVVVTLVFCHAVFCLEFRELERTDEWNLHNYAKTRKSSCWQTGKSEQDLNGGVYVNKERLGNCRSKIKWVICCPVNNKNVNLKHGNHFYKENADSFFGCKQF